MKSRGSYTRIVVMAFVAAVCCVALTGCEYDVPITDGPTRRIDERLVGDWLASDGQERMKVRRMDDFVYVVSYDGELFRAFHSDVAGVAFITVQNIDSAERKYSYLTYALSADGSRLGLRVVNPKVIPENTPDSARVRRLLEANAHDPALLNAEDQFTREK